MPQTLPTLSCQTCSAWKKSIFSDLGPSALSKLDRYKSSEVYEKGESLSRQGQQAEEVYCVSRGAAKVVKSLPGQDKESIVRIATSGEMLGYRCIFSEKEYRATAVAIEQSVACKINKQFIFELIKEEPSFALKMLEWFGKDVAAAENHHHSFCLKNTRERVAEALHIIANKCGVETAKGILIPIHIMRTDWAEWIGIAKENLIRCFSDFKKEGLISQEGDYILVLDMRRIAVTAAVER